jgi:hypothetical protein
VASPACDMARPSGPRLKPRTQKYILENKTRLQIKNYYKTFCKEHEAPVTKREWTKFEKTAIRRGIVTILARGACM